MMRKILIGSSLLVLTAGLPLYGQTSQGGGMHSGATASQQSPQSAQGQGAMGMQGGMMGGMMSGMMGGGMMQGMMGHQGGMMGCMMGSGMMGGQHILSTMHLKHAFQKAMMMTTDPEKKKEIRSLKMKVMEKVIRQKAEVQIAQMELKDLLSDPNFDPKAVKKAMKKVMDAKATLQSTVLNGFVSLRETVGSETFSKVFPCPMGMMGQGGMMMSTPQGPSQQ